LTDWPSSKYSRPATRPFATTSLWAWAPVDLEIVRALVVAAIEVVDLGDADLGRRVAHRVEDVPGNARPLDAPLAAGRVQLAFAAVMVLVAEEIGQHVVPAPAPQPQLPPAVVIGRLTAHVNHPVDRGAAADDATARISDVAAVQARLRRGAEAPVGALMADRVEVSDGDMKPDPIVAATGFDEQHPVFRIGAQPIGQQASRRPRADDDVIIGFVHASDRPTRDVSSLLGL